ncbi:MAG: hypothetical protein ACK5MP_08260 [Nostocoides sp.]
MSPIGVIEALGPRKVQIRVRTGVLALPRESVVSTTSGGGG